MPSAIAALRMYCQRRVAAGTCWRMRDRQRRKFRSSSWPRQYRLADRVLFNPSIGRHRAQRGSQRLRYRRVRFQRQRKGAVATLVGVRLSGRRNLPAAKNEYGRNGVDILATAINLAHASWASRESPLSVAAPAR
jgi:hypothetical protein